MRKKHQYPAHIFTNYLSICGIQFSHEEEWVILHGCYANLWDGENETIIIETNFDMLNRLLEEAMPEQAEPVINALAQKLGEGGEGEVSIALVDDLGVWLDFMEHVFSLLVVVEEGREEEPLGADNSYYLNGYIERTDLVPHWLEWEKPTTEEGWAQHYNRLLAMQYAMYKQLATKMPEDTALACANLTDPIIYNTAKAQWEMWRINNK